jgi:RNA polymerase sigma factor (sigma-70 family)
MDNTNNTTTTSKFFFDNWQKNPSEANKLMLILSMNNYILSISASVVRRLYRYMDKNDQKDLIEETISDVWLAMRKLNTKYNYKEVLGYISKTIENKFNKKKHLEERIIKRQHTDVVLDFDIIGYNVDHVSNFYKLIDDIGELGHADRQLLIGRYLYGYSFLQISKELGLTRQGAQQRIAQLLKRIRRKRRRIRVLDDNRTNRY